MKTLVVYVSKTGFTQKYAQWIAEELNCDLLPFSKKTKSLFANYELIIFGGGIMGGMINGLKDFKKCPEYSLKNMIVFATGATDHNAERIIQSFITTNFSEEEQKKIPFFFFESGINYTDMSFFPKMLLKMMHNMLAKKKDLTAEDKGMLETIASSCDYTKKEYIEPLVEFVKNKSN